MTDWGFTFNGLDLGAGTVYRLEKLTGFHDLPDVRTSDSDRARAHGQYPGIDMLGGRRITAAVTVDTHAPTVDRNTVMQAFSQAMVAARTVELPLVAQLPGVAGGRSVQIGARVRRLAAPIDFDYRAGAARADVEWWATDPRIYDAVLTTISTAIASVAVTGRTYPRVYPLSYGGAITGGIVNATNDGEFPSPWVATISGPVTNPRFENITTGKTISFVGVVAAGETLTVDSDLKSVVLNGTASRYSWLTAGSEWFDLDPGVNQLRFAGSAGTGSLQLEYRSAWI